MESQLPELDASPRSTFGGLLAIRAVGIVFQVSALFAGSKRRTSKSGIPVKILLACISRLKEFDEIGEMPCFPLNYFFIGACLRYLNLWSQADYPFQEFFVGGTDARRSFSSVASRLSRSNRLLKQSCRRDLLAPCGRLYQISAVIEENWIKEPETMPAEEKMIWAPIVQDGVFRFDASEAAKKQACPSVSFQNGQHRETPIPVKTNLHVQEPLYIPECKNDNGSQIITVTLPAGTSLYGTGECGGSLERTGKRVFTWNTDAWGYGPSTTALYQSHPWVLAVLPDGTAFGVLADTTKRVEIDTRKEGTIRFVASGDYPVVTIGPYPTPEEVVTALSKATGTVAMPPKWTLGFQQCRWSYDTADIVRKIATTFREKKLPCDVVWMDIDYMDGWRCFTFDPEAFPDPAKLSDFLHDIGFKGVWMLDPGIKREPGWPIYDSGTKKDVWVLTKDKAPYVGDVWPGPCVFPDYTQAKTREWWGELVKEFVKVGVDGIWNDMNEPAVFKTLSKTMPESNIHRGDEDLGGTQDHQHYHNVYGMLMARSTYQGMLLANPQKRPFVLTRAGYIGSQRYAATWTGDNLSNWVHLQMSIPMSLNLALSGQPFSGPDIGGFGGNATPQLFARWMGIGAMFPFSRGHSEKGTLDHEPWAFGKECEDVCRMALNRRYRVLPHLYTLFYHAHMTGTPVMSPLFFSDPKDQTLRNVDNSFLLGPLLVAASTEMGKTVNPKNVVLPQGIWQLFDFEDFHHDLPLLILQGGAIIPTGPVVQSVGEMRAEDPVTLLVALDENGKAEGVLYEDDGESYEYKNGQFLYTRYGAELDLSSSKVVVKVLNSDGSLKRPKRQLKVRLLLANKAELEGEGVDGEEVTVALPSDFDMARITTIFQEQDLPQQGGNDLAEEVDYETNESHAVPPTMLVDLKCGDWLLKVAPWIGGRIVSMVHEPTGFEWLEGKLEKGAYEEYSSTEWRSPGCVEQYDVKKELLEDEGPDGVVMEGDIGGGLVMRREITGRPDSPKAVQISSSIEARSVGAGSGGFSRLVCLRVHPSFKVPNYELAVVKYTTLRGEEREVHAEPGDIFLTGDDRPNGKWVFSDKENGMSIVNKFNPEEVATCVIHWSVGICNLELWSEERPVSKETPIRITHEYESWNDHDLNVGEHQKG
ncbi:hypothetical protein R1sor_024163 [Riccia sorocarpa]|uniref:Alpha-glucosidase n=1 Tax=Riccia sorocarpa TaxID=122646 RepID=A0ABD3GRX1_9MARC